MIRMRFASVIWALSLSGSSLLEGCAPSPSASIPANGGSPASGGDTGSGGTLSGGGAGGSTTVGAGGTPAAAGSTGTAGNAAGTAGSMTLGGAGGSATVGAGGTPVAGGSTGTAGNAAGTAGSMTLGGAGGSAGAVASAGSGGSGGNGGAGGMTSCCRSLPCDIYSTAGTPCAAAHSTVRALYTAYSGALYQVQRASDKATKDIPLTADGFADTAVQDSFCAGTTCTIPVIYDQSPNGNHLRVTWFAYWLQTGANPATANAARVTIGGHAVYGVKSGTNVGYRSGEPLSGAASINKGSPTVTFSIPQTLAAHSALLFVSNAQDCPSGSWPTGCNFHTYYTSTAVNNSTTVTLTTAYSGTSNSSSLVWNATTKGVATGDQPESEYAVFDGTTYGQGCCFDYGNANMSGIDEGSATVEAVSWGSGTQFGQPDQGNGPWIGADLGNGTLLNYDLGSTNLPSNTLVTSWPYVTAMVEGPSASSCPSGFLSSGCIALKAGDASSGKLQSKWDANGTSYGPRPAGYSPQKKQGAIILATGADGANMGVGVWFEGAITMGASPDSADDAVQANIVAAGYGH